MPKHSIPSDGVSKYRTYNNAELLNLIDKARSSSEILNEVCRRLEKVDENETICGEYDAECPICSTNICCIVEVDGVTLKEV